MASTKLNIHFHDPNSEEDTYKMISGVLADLCVKKIKKMIVEDNSAPVTLTNTQNLAS